MNISDETKGFIAFLICCVMVTSVVASCEKQTIESVEKTKQVAMENGFEHGLWVKIRTASADGAACKQE